MSVEVAFFLLAFRPDVTSDEEDAAERRLKMGSAFDQIHIKDNRAEQHTFTLLSSALQSRGFNQTQGGLCVVS